jgi:hypothetical protein
MSTSCATDNRQTLRDFRRVITRQAAIPAASTSRQTVKVEGMTVNDSALIAIHEGR